MGLKEKIRLITIYSLTFYLSALISSQFIFRNETRLKRSYSITRPDGLLIFSSIEYKHDFWDEEKSDKSDKVRKSRFFINTFYHDGTPYGKYDGKVDNITIYRPFKTLELDRNDDYDSYKKEFDEADSYLAKTKDRFKAFSAKTELEQRTK